MIVRLEHLGMVRGYSTRPGFCRSKARVWFKRHGLDWNDFRHNGIESSVLLSTGCALAAALVRTAEEAESNHGATDGR